MKFEKPWIVWLACLLMATVASPPASADPSASPAPNSTAEKAGSDSTALTRNGRTDEEVLRQAQEDYERAEVLFREAAVAEPNLWESINFYQRVQAELALVDPSLWPKFAGDIPSQLQRAQGMLDQEYRRIKMSYVGYYQSADWRRAEQELELFMRKIPAPSDPRHQWARNNKAKVKERLRAMEQK